LELPELVLLDLVLPEKLGDHFLSIYLAAGLRFHLFYLLELAELFFVQLGKYLHTLLLAHLPAHDSPGVFLAQQRLLLLRPLIE